MTSDNRAKALFFACQHLKHRAVSFPVDHFGPVSVAIIQRMGEHHTNHAATAQFIARWTGKTASELSTAQSFVIELCTLLGVAPPTHELDYMFERPITFRHGDGSTSAGVKKC